MTNLRLVIGGAALESTVRTFRCHNGAHEFKVSSPLTVEAYGKPEGRKALCPECVVAFLAELCGASEVHPPVVVHPIPVVPAAEGGAAVVLPPPLPVGTLARMRAAALAQNPAADPETRAAVQAAVQDAVQVVGRGRDLPGADRAPPAARTAETSGAPWAGARLAGEGVCGRCRHGDPHYIAAGQDVCTHPGGCDCEHFEAPEAPGKVADAFNQPVPPRDDPYNNKFSCTIHNKDGSDPECFFCPPEAFRKKEPAL